MEFPSFEIYGVAVKHSKEEDKEFQLVESMKKYIDIYIDNEIQRNYYLVQIYTEDFLSGDTHRFVTFVGISMENNPSNEHLTKLYVPYSNGYSYTFKGENSTKSIDEIYEAIYLELENNGITLQVNYDFENWKENGDILMYFPVSSVNISIPKTMSLQSFLLTE